MDPYGQQENDEVIENIVDFSDNSDTRLRNGVLFVLAWVAWLAC